MRKSGLFFVLFCVFSWALWAEDGPAIGLDRSLELNRQMEAGLLNLRQTIADLNESLGQQTSDLSLLMDDYLRLEGLYGDLQTGTQVQLETLTVSLTSAESRAGFWKRFAVWSIPVSVGVGVGVGFLVAMLSRR